MFGQYGHFVRFAKDKCDHPYPAERYGNEAKRLLGVIESRLQGRKFLVDDGYSIADMATFPWIRYARNVYEEKLEFHRFPTLPLGWIAVTRAPPPLRVPLSVNCHIEMYAMHLVHPSM